PPMDGNNTLANCNQTFASNFGSTPLDIVAQGDNSIFPGTVWAVTYGANNITIFEPADYNGNTPSPCTGNNNDAIDEDGDLYTNADEIANGTNPCSAASKPDDFDNALEFGSGNIFKRSDKMDSDDDNDGISDITDPFQWDIDNGKGTNGNLPIVLELFNSTGYGYGSIGFTGWMTNGTTDYHDLTDGDDELILGGAAGLYTDPTVSDGTAIGSANNQKNGFQFGANVNMATGPFTITTQINGPFFSGNLPQPNAAHGMQMGAGDQNNYVQLVVSQGIGDATVPGFQILYENNGSVANQQQLDVPNLLDVDAIVLYLSVNPVAGTVQAKYSTIENSVPSEVKIIGSTIVLSSKLLDAVRGNYTINNKPIALAIGPLATSAGPSPEFGATWDYFRVEQDPTSAKADVAITTGNINGSTFSGGFRVENQSTNGEKITKVIFDLSTGVIPELVFDPNGTAGDAVAKGFTPGNNTGVSTGVTTHNFTNAYEGGFYRLEINFTDFAPSEFLTFAVDVDPISIKGGASPGPNESGSVSGLELAGSTVTVVFSNGQTHQAQLYRTQENNPGSARNMVRSQLPATPSIEMLDVPNKTIVSSPSQRVRVSGPVDAQVMLLQLEAGLFINGLTGPHANVGYDIDSFEVNSIIAINEYDGVIGTDGTVEFEVTLTKGHPEAGYNIFAAVTVDPDEATSNLSNIIIVKYDNALSTPIVLQPISNQTTNEGAITPLVVNASGGDGALQFSATGLPPGLIINPTNGQISGTISTGASSGGPNNNGVYNITVKVDDSDGVTTDAQTSSFTWTVLPPGNNSSMVLSITLEGRTNHSGNFTVALYQPGTTAQIGTTYNSTANTSGSMTVNNLKPGTYDIRIKHPQYLAKLINRTLVAGANTLTGGQLKTGDANNDNVVSALDFSILAATFNKLMGNNGYDDRADFNNDDRISALDFSLMTANYNKAGAKAGDAPNITDSTEKRMNWMPVDMLLGSKHEVVKPGEIFQTQLLIKAGEQAIDAVEAHLQFDPELLEVTSIHWEDNLEIQLRETIDNTAGVLHLAAGSLVQMPTDDVAVATLNFRAKKLGETAIAFTNMGALQQEVTYQGINILENTLNQQVTIQATTAAEDLASDDLQLELYPIPSKGNVTLELKRAASFFESEVQIFNALGQVIFQRNYTGNVREVIDLSRQPKGVYQVQVKNENQVITKNITIQ
ncbi:MAG: T9SS type A sorting domain-containing protein, partial [Saprospiraceae bacterium]